MKSKFLHLGFLISVSICLFAGYQLLQGRELTRVKNSISTPRDTVFKRVYHSPDKFMDNIWIKVTMVDLAPQSGYPSIYVDSAFLGSDTEWKRTDALFLVGVDVKNKKGAWEPARYLVPLETHGAATNLDFPVKNVMETRHAPNLDNFIRTVELKDVQ